MDLSKVSNNLLRENITLGKKQNIETDSFKNILKESTAKQDSKALKKACREFESYLTTQMFKEMRNTVKSGGLITKSQGEKIFEDMLYQEYANETSKGRGIGIADMMYKQLKK